MNYNRIRDGLAYEVLNAETYEGRGMWGLINRFIVSRRIRDHRAAQKWGIV